MHKSIVTHVAITNSTVICGSDDGRLTFWHRDTSSSSSSTSDDANSNPSLTYIKAFQAHPGPFSALHITNRQDIVCSSSSSDKTLQLFTINTVDLTQFITLAHTPGSSLVSISNPDRLIVPFVDHPHILILSLNDISLPGVLVSTLHQGPVSHISTNTKYNSLIICAASSSALDYASIPAHQLFSPAANDNDIDDEDDNDSEEKKGGSQQTERKLVYSVSGVNFRSRLRTDLLQLAKDKTTVSCISVNSTGDRFAVSASDHRIRVFDYLTGKIIKMYDEGISNIDRVSATLGISGQELARRKARDTQFRDDDATVSNANVIWDESGSCILYATMFGIKVVHVSTSRIVRILGLREAAVRFVCVALAYSRSSTDEPDDITIPCHSNKVTVEKVGKYDDGGSDDKDGSGRPISIINGKMGPLMIAGGFNSERVYLFGSGNQDKVKESNRDVHNERPIFRKRQFTNLSNTNSALYSRGEEAASQCDRVTLHTSLGDIAIKLLGGSAPKTVENFVTHSKNGYFNGVTFHRIIKNFMIQSGDPDGDGTGGESIWGAAFEDEIDDELSHEIGTVSMANSGPNTNASQFFIVCGKASHLNGKHSIFGKVTKGIAVVKQIEGVHTDKEDRPTDAVTIESVSVHHD